MLMVQDGTGVADADGAGMPMTSMTEPSSHQYQQGPYQWHSYIVLIILILLFLSIKLFLKGICFKISYMCVII